MIDPRRWGFFFPPCVFVFSFLKNADGGGWRKKRFPLFF